MDKLARYLTPGQAGDRLRAIGAEAGATEFAEVRNLGYVFPRGELYPLAPVVRPPLERVVAFAVDMDGTSTDTEAMAVHSLEYMVRRITGRRLGDTWVGLDPRLDVPFIVGNSNFRHVEFLLERYRSQINREAFAEAFIEATAFTLGFMPDKQRRQAMVLDARNCGLAPMLADKAWWQEAQKWSKLPLDADFPRAALGYAPAFAPANAAAEVAAALDIYYMRYHHFLRMAESPWRDDIAEELFGQKGMNIVDPMPGYEVFVPLVKGWLGAEVDNLYELLRARLLSDTSLGHTAEELDAFRPRLVRLAERFARQPAQLALVTASIAYEAHVCMSQVMRHVAGRVMGWPIPASTRDRLAERLADYEQVFDGFACASDVWEARLKPHRDLYSLALFQMSVPREDYRCVVGLEDTEPGIVALRAAGVGCAVALPSRDTCEQDYTAAADVVRGGLPELILVRNLLLREEGGA